MTSRVAWPLAAAAAVAACAAALILTRHASPPHPRPSQPAQTRPRAAVYSSDTYDGAVAELLARTANAEMLAASSPESFHRHAEAAGYRLDYGQLTGDYAGYIAAEAHMAAAFAAVERRGVPAAQTGTGPFLLKAQLDYTLHRFTSTLKDLDAPERDAAQTHDRALLAEIKALRGSATFARGDYDAGLALLREAERLDASPSHRQRLALALAKIGEESEALTRLAPVPGAATSRRGQAWAALQRALIDLAHGRRAEARVKLGAAAALFPGYWLVEEHLAELDADEGQTEAAKAAYRRLVERTGDPEYMDALARLVAREAPDEARSLVARASAIHGDRLARLPEAAAGHALEHMLRMDPDPTRAVTLAEKNRDLRPDGEALTHLAQAYLRARRIDDAKREIGKVLASRWVSGETYATGALVHRASRDETTARALEAKALRENRYAIESLAWLEASGPP